MRKWNKSEGNALIEPRVSAEVLNDKRVFASRSSHRKEWDELGRILSIYLSIKGQKEIFGK